MAPTTLAELAAWQCGPWTGCGRTEQKCPANKNADNTAKKPHKNVLALREVGCMNSQVQVKLEQLPSRDDFTKVCCRLHEIPACEAADAKPPLKWIPPGIPPGFLKRVSFFLQIQCNKKSSQAMSLSPPFHPLLSQLLSHTWPSELGRREQGREGKCA